LYSPDFFLTLRCIVKMHFVMEPIVNFTPDIDIKDAVVIVHLEGQPDMPVQGRFIKMSNGFIHLYGNLLKEEPKVSVESQKSAAATESNEIRSYMDRSALVRFMHEGRFCTGAVTHVTDKAWRVFNLELGAAWMPKSVLRWSGVAEQFCVVDEDYYPVFTKEVSEEMNEFPIAFEPTDLIDELYR